MSVSALVMAAVGIYGLMSFSVAQRTREIGIRMAVGAQPRQILLMVLARAFVLVALGIAVGLPLALGSFRVAASFLYGVTRRERMRGTPCATIDCLERISA